jgi:hypothetical protein
MTLISIRLALREGECENVKIEDFQQDISIISTTEDVKSLALVIQVSIQCTYFNYLTCIVRENAMSIQ